MKAALISSAVIIAAISSCIVLWQLFFASHRRDAQIDSPWNSATSQRHSQLWNSFWTDPATLGHNRTNLGWLFTLPRKYYDPEYRHVLLDRKWRASATFQKKQRGEKPRDFDGMREKRASSIVTYFCIFVLVLSLIRAALDMNSNLKKAREENVNQTINLDSRRCSLNDFKLAQAQLKKKEQNIRRACLLRRAMTIVENQPGGGSVENPVTKSMNNLDAKEAVKGEVREKLSLEKQSSLHEVTPAGSNESPSRIKPRFSSVSPSPVHRRRMSFPALRRGSSMDVVVNTDMEELISHHSPEVKRRMRLLRH